MNNAATINPEVWDEKTLKRLEGYCECGEEKIPLLMEVWHGKSLICSYCGRDNACLGVEYE